MIVDLGKYILRSDGLSMWIEEKYVSKEKNDERSRRITGYMRDFKGLLGSFTERKIKDSEAESTKEVIKDLAEIEKDLLRIVENINEETNKKVTKNLKER